MTASRAGEDRVIGRHVYGSLYGIPANLAGDEGYLRDLVLRAVESSGATLLDLRSWKVPGKKGGVSVIAVVLESHIALHTWVEYRYATVDAYTCGDSADPWKAWETILEGLKPEYYTVHYADRSQLPQRAPHSPEGRAVGTAPSQPRGPRPRL
ncbi:MAG: adenosylmethionine decarboxylase [Desulfurococcales archaeon]|nr:adenosylmethionine decarboxylase [Desulfurococcales archaeon]